MAHSGGLSFAIAPSEVSELHRWAFEEMQLPPPPADYSERMPRVEEESRLRVVGHDTFGREIRLAECTATAWSAMRRDAQAEGIQLLLVSGFRSVSRQEAIVQRKLDAGLSLDAILRVNAYPGFSEHHSGRAIDFGSPDCEHLSEAFEGTREFAWLVLHAAEFGFSLSYPRGNPHGIAYEPWHWCMRKP